MFIVYNLVEISNSFQHLYLMQEWAETNSVKNVPKPVLATHLIHRVILPHLVLLLQPGGIG